ncbi:hypothetical protein AK830_g1108 [Neonectria ditissima]|uniref:BTB domain-containing protein n=1 Tax=Neonectria ditissima TaxID=78410 RepID=A0A0P7BJQ2_9HYPO|nr:hypothetical protein AK830_g1108 [Neonectria ditissima]
MDMPKEPRFVKPHPPSAARSYRCILFSPSSKLHVGCTRKSVIDDSSDPGDATALVMSRLPPQTRARAKATAVVSNTLAQGTTLEVDPAGDLYLTVGNDAPQEMLVDSRALCRSSPVFRKMLSANFSEAKPTHGTWQVRLPADEPTAFALLMNIIHNAYRQVPRKLEIALTKAGFIAWVMGHDKLLERVAREITWRLKMNDDKELVYADGKPFQETPYFGLIQLTARLIKGQEENQMILRKGCRGITQQLIEGINPQKFCKRNKCRRHSRLQGSPAILGDLLQMSFKLGIMELFVQTKTSPKLRKPPIKLWNKIYQIQLSKFSCSCGGAIASAMAYIEDESRRVAPLLSEWHYKHLSVQAAKTNVLSQP